MPLDCKEYHHLIFWLMFLPFKTVSKYFLPFILFPLTASWASITHPILLIRKPRLSLVKGPETQGLD